MTRARDLAAFVSNADGDIKFDTDTLFIDSSTNRVGIGTDTPDTILELKGADPILTIRDSETSSGSANATLRLAETGASDALGSYWDIKSDGGSLEFIDNWNEGGGTGTRVVINDSGNVGIGTASIDVSTQAGGSGYKALQIESDEGGQINFDHNDAGTGSTLGQLNFQRAGEVVAEMEGVTDGATDSGRLVFRTQPDGGALTERMRIDHNGVITKPNQPAFSVGITSNNWTTATSGTLVPFDSEHFDTGNNFNTSTYKFTAPVTGRYFWSIFINRLTDSRFDLSIYKNGNQQRTLEMRELPSDSSSIQWHVEGASVILSLSANDVVDWRV